MKIYTTNDKENILNIETDLVSEDELKQLKDIVNEMISLCKEYGGVGLAANQVSINKKLFVYLKDNEFDVIINPIIKVKKDKVTNYNEGCLSLPGQYYDVKRFKNIVIEGLDLDGNKIKLKAPNKKIAFIWQHEIDHLNGILISEKGK